MHARTNTAAKVDLVDESQLQPASEKLEASLASELHTRAVQRIHGPASHASLSDLAIWVISAAAAGIAGNVAYAAFCELIRNVAARRSGRVGDIETTFHNVVTEEVWEELRVRIHSDASVDEISVVLSRRTEQSYVRKIRASSGDASGDSP